MSEQESNVCAICGGAKAIWYHVEAVTKADLSERIEKAISKPGAPFRICPGHPEPAPKHDGEFGRLDENGSRVWHDPSWGYDCVGIALHDGERCYIRPKQALSLLAWLTQEREELQRLAKEQGE